MLGIDYAIIFGRSIICTCAGTCSILMPTSSQSASICQTHCMYACLLYCLQLEEHEALEHMSCRMQVWATRKNRCKHLLRAFVNDSVLFVQALGCVQSH